MTDKEVLRDLISSIDSVKERAKAAMLVGDIVSYTSLMYDLLALENLLVAEVSKDFKDELKRA